MGAALTAADDYRAFKAGLNAETNAHEEMTNLKLIVADISTDPRVLVFRNNVGCVKYVDERTGEARRVTYGLCVGSSDLIGSVTQPAGHAIPFAIEVKSSTGRATEDQRRFIEAVRRAGWLAGIARNPTEARAILGM